MQDMILAELNFMKYFFVNSFQTSEAMRQMDGFEKENKYLKDEVSVLFDSIQEQPLEGLIFLIN